MKRLKRSIYVPRDLVPYKLWQSRGNPILTYWCAPNSQTYVVFQAIQTVTGPSIPEMLLNLYNQLSRKIQRGGDGVIDSGVYRWGPLGPGALGAKFVNVNNHQLTYGVVHAAVAALRDYMASDGDYGLLSFEIWDGDNEVGTGVIGDTPRLLRSSSVES